MGCERFRMGGSLILFTDLYLAAFYKHLWESISIR